MISKEYKRLYWLTLAVLIVLSAYPLINGMRMAYLSITKGFIEPEQYAKYVIPYAAICTATVLFAAFQPLLFGIKGGAFPIGLTGAYAVFAAIENFFERIQIRVAGMTLIDPASLSADSTIILPSTAVDAWQASLCIISPLTRGQSIAYASQDRYFYIMANNTYKIHYYLISFILITMVCGLVYGIQHMIHTGDKDRKKPLILQGVATAALVALCVFANTTAFFRQPEAIQTPLASVLTCMFFVVLGAAAGVYVGSFLLRKSKRFGLGIPVLLSVITVLLMYIGEAAMMEGNLYRFGTGWLFEGIPSIALAPVDILIIILSGILTWLVLHFSRQYESWPGKQTTVIAIFLCVFISSIGIGISVSNAQNDDNDIFGCYEFDDCLYMNPLSSSMATKGFMPYIYGLGEDALIIANTETGYIQQLSAQYEDTAVAEDEFESKSKFTIFPLPNISQYKERRLRAVFIGEGGQKYNLYQMDDEVWLVRLGSEEIGIWSIYRLRRTDKLTFPDLKYRLDIQNNGTDGKTQMGLRNIYALARKGKKLTLKDFDKFSGKVVGTGFTTMRYDIEGGCVLIVHSSTQDSSIDYARLSKQGYNPFDEALTVDIRDGAEAVAEYLNPLHSLAELKIEDSHRGVEKRELIYEFDGYRYFLNTTRADQIFITFDNGDRLPLKQALEERRTIIEDLVANGLRNVFMEPIENPMDGFFPILHHLHKFSFDGEEFYPSTTFMYIVTEDHLAVYFDIVELIEILEFQGKNELAEKLRFIENTSNLPVIAGKAYIESNGLAEAQITVEIGWNYSSHTPVSFTSTNK